MPRPEAVAGMSRLPAPRGRGVHEPGHCDLAQRRLEKPVAAVNNSARTTHTPTTVTDVGGGKKTPAGQPPHSPSGHSPQNADTPLAEPATPPGGGRSCGRRRSRRRWRGRWKRWRRRRRGGRRLRSRCRRRREGRGRRGGRRQGCAGTGRRGRRCSDLGAKCRDLLPEGLQVLAVAAAGSQHGRSKGAA